MVCSWEVLLKCCLWKSVFGTSRSNYCWVCLSKSSFITYHVNVNWIGLVEFFKIKKVQMFHIRKWCHKSHIKFLAKRVFQQHIDIVFSRIRIKQCIFISTDSFSLLTVTKWERNKNISFKYYSPIKLWILNIWCFIIHLWI